ncbi:transposable element Tcb1 transposase [Trichonephila clavipes]|uniref:Transposable element Tcb1 transposase n=1 Tax=Trichonephila clavipes TaxID=2585209 RepID=A0A8X6R483_TRICX|nr:transposable element Tcb1 transposase [Trichonephila clavipes]
MHVRPIGLDPKNLGEISNPWMNSLLRSDGVDPDAEAQPVAVGEEKGLSRESSNVPLISADDEMYEEKEEKPVDVIKDKAKLKLSGATAHKGRAYCAHPSIRDHWALRKNMKVIDNRVHDSEPWSSEEKGPELPPHPSSFLVPPTSTTPAEDRYIILSAKRKWRITAQQVANQFLAASGKQISRKTVARRLRGGLYARRPVVCVPLTRQHRTDRLQWCREHHNWTEQDSACVLFSEESRFSLSLDCRRQLIWRESGTAYRPKNIQEKDRYPTCSIMVWAGIMINGRTRLHVVANGTMTGQRYIDEVLLPHVRLFRGAVGDKFVFMDDNATCHRTLAVQDCLDSEGIQRLLWPARSPDLNPIENVWDALGRQVAGRNYPPTNKSTLIRALTEEWDKLPQQLLDNIVQSMVRRVECCITLHGGHIPY